MSDIKLITASTKTVCLEIAKQASALGAGLQNAAPGDRAGTPNNSVQYLLSIADSLKQIAEGCEILLGQTPQSSRNTP